MEERERGSADQVEGFALSTSPAPTYFFLPLLFSTWLSADPAADLDFLLVRLSRRTLEAALAAFLLVVFFAKTLSPFKPSSYFSHRSLYERVFEINGLVRLHILYVNHSSTVV